MINFESFNWEDKKGSFQESCNDSENNIPEIDTDITKEFIPSELKVLLRHQEVEFETKLEKAQNEVRRVSQVNEDLVQQVEDYSLELDFIRYFINL